MTTMTAFCLDKRFFDGIHWSCLNRIEQSVQTRHCFEIPDAWIDRYFKYSLCMQASGAIAIELYGAQFLKWIDGSYTNVVGLPMFELRSALDSIGFFRDV